MIRAQAWFAFPFEERVQRVKKTRQPQLDFAEGEYQGKNGRYRFRYLGEDGNEQNVYSWQLDQSNPMPKGKKHGLFLREKEKQIYLPS